MVLPIPRTAAWIVPVSFITSLSKRLPRCAARFQRAICWVRKAGNLYAVLSRKEDSFEFEDLKPGDLLFWRGTYNIDRDPPITHTMIYLGREKRTNKRVMIGSSDGRTYDGKQRWGVSVFDFKMPPPPKSGDAN